MGKIIVTGGAGYIGSHTAKLLKKQNKEVIIVDNLEYGHRDIVENNLKIELVIGNIGDKNLISNILSRNQIDAIMHFSAYAYVGESVTSPSKYYQNNFVNTLNLLDVMIENHVLNFIFSSTCATYGIPQKIPIEENAKQIPINPYGNTKLAIEKLLADYDNAYKLKYIIFRYFNAAGADIDKLTGEDHTPETHIIPLIMYAALNKIPHFQIFGDDYDTTDGTCVRDYIHVLDIANAHTLGLEYLLKNQKSDYFNLGNEQGFSVKEIIQKTEKIIGKKIPTVINQRRDGDPPILIGNAEKAKKILKWKTTHSNIEQILQSAWEWHKSRHIIK